MPFYFCLQFAAGLINLHKLNLDHTDVSQNCLRYLEGNFKNNPMPSVHPCRAYTYFLFIIVLSQLQPVRLTGITKLIDEDDKDND